MTERISPDDETLAQADEQALTPQPRHSVAGYRVERFLGRGAYGEVWLAHHINTGRNVAIKFFSGLSGLDWPLLRREVGKLAQASSERRIVHLLEVGWDAHPPYYVMEYLEGGSLAAEVAKGPLPAPRAVALVRDVGIALRHLHSKAILHCDLKPSNVLLDASGQIRLADFGQARALGEEGSAAGTLFYMAPELCEPSARPDVRSDIYSLGALLFTLLTGRPPYADAALPLKRETGPYERVARYREIIAASPPPFAHRRVAGVDPSLAAIIDCCLARDPAHRYENVQQMLDALTERDRRRTLRPLLRFSLVGPILILAAMSAMGLFTWRDTERQARAALSGQAVDALRGKARLVASGVDQHLRIAQRRVAHEGEKDDLREMMARATALGHPDKKPGLAQRLEDRLQQLYRDHADQRFYSWTLADGRGVAWARAPYDANVVGTRYAYREWFSGEPETRERTERAARRATGLTRAFVSTARDKPIVMSVASPIWAPGPAGVGEPVGVIASTFDVGRFHEWLSVGEGERRDDGCPERFAILLNRGQLSRHPCPAEGGPRLPLDPEAFYRPAGIASLLERGATDAYRDPLRGEHAYVAAAAALPTHPDWAVVVQQDRDRVLSPIAALADRFHTLARAAIVVGGLMAAALLALLWRLAHRS